MENKKSSLSSPSSWIWENVGCLGRLDNVEYGTYDLQVEPSYHLKEAKSSKLDRKIFLKNRKEEIKYNSEIN